MCYHCATVAPEIIVIQYYVLKLKLDFVKYFFEKRNSFDMDVSL